MKRVEVFRWKFYDAMIRETRLTSLHHPQEEAERRFPGSIPDLTTREIRYVPEHPDEFRPSALDDYY